MSEINFEITCFDKPGPNNTDKALKIAKKYAQDLNIEDIVLASTTGTTAEKVSDQFDLEKYNVVVITHSYYFVGSKIRQEFDETKMEELKQKGLKFHVGTHAMSGIERGLRIKKQPWIFVDLLARVMQNIVCQGFKVCIEIASMAADAGLIPDLDRDIICIAGTGRGADTVCIIQPAPTSEFMDLRVKAILCKPK
ncbi:MAG: pyruvate kinase alpha/beta domain-containing protein [Promethearchaeati archaeon]